MYRFLLTSIVVMSMSGTALAEEPDQRDLGPIGPFPAVTFGVQTFLQYAAELHEENGYNALFAYLDAVETSLKDSPDRADKLAELGQSAGHVSQRLARQGTNGARQGRLAAAFRRVR